MAPLIPNAMRRPQAVGIAYAVVGLLAWRGEMRGVKNRLERGDACALGWLPFCKLTHNNQLKFGMDNGG